MARTDGLSESQRNKLLRRVDWRFLLGIDQLPTTVSFAGSGLTRALELVSSSVSRAGGGKEAADLAVLVSPRTRSLTAAYDALRPGGEVYAEWYLPSLGGARRRLEAAGFVNVRCYLTWPWPQRSPKFWLPLGAPAAVESFLASRPRVGHRRNTLLRRAWRVAVGLKLMIPICTIAEKPGAAVDEARASGDTPPTNLSWVLLTGGRRSINKVVGLGFADAETRPRLAVKFARSASEDDPLEQEATTLRTLRDTAVNLTGVPEVLFVGRRSGRVALGETAVAGQPLLHRLDHDSLPAVASQVTSWLVDLARAAADVQPRASWAERLIENPVRDFERMFASVLDAEETAQARRILSTLTDLPLVCEHRDCSPWNLLHDDHGGLAVVDWESSEPRGLPGLDLAYFLTYAALFVEQTMDTSRGAETYARTMERHSTVGAVVRACEQSYCERVGLDPEQLHPLRLLCWIVHSRSEYRQLEQDAVGTPTQEALARSFFLSLWRQELRRHSAVTASSGLDA
jgi:hypothetical protein